MFDESASAWKRYGIAVAAVALAVFARALVSFFIGTKLPYLTFLPAIMLAALYGGYRAGLLAIALSATFALLWMNPVLTLDSSATVDQVGFVLFIGVSALIVWLGEQTQRTTFEAARLNQKYTTILESISDAFFAVDPEWRFIYLNSKAEEFLGKTRAELLGRNIWDAFPQARGSIFEEMYQRAMNDRTALGFEAQSTLSEKWLGVNAYPSAEGLSVYSRDITKRKQAERDREELLERELEARQTAESANRLKDEFLATVSHELRTPLNSILGWAAIARTADFPPEKIQQALDIIERNARSQNNIIEDILDVSRIITGKLHLQMSSVDLVPVIEAALESVRPAADARQINIQIDFKGAGKDALVQGDASRLQQIIWNLLSNAVKFTGESGRVEVGLKRADHYLEISVRDTGEGIAAEFLPFVFDRFRQAEGGTNRKHGGLGLGLAIVRHLTELHGGSVSAESDGKGTGSTFFVRLPSEARQTVFAETKDSSQYPPSEKNGSAADGIEADAAKSLLLSGKRILVVDDEPDARDLVSLILKKCGAQVDSADSAENALLKMSENFPDVMISDIGMPETDGYDLLGKIREVYPQAINLKTIALTAYARKEDEQQALSAGFHSHLPKPLEPERLIEKICELSNGAGKEH